MDVDDFLGNVDRVHQFIVMGGETFLHPELKRFIRHLISRDKIDLVHLFSNGSVIPKPDMMQLLRNHKIILTVSSVPVNVSPNKRRFIDSLEVNHINFIVANNLWRDLGGFSPDVNNSVDVLKKRFSKCGSQVCHQLINGKYHLCPRSGHGEQLGQFSPDGSDSIIFRNRRNPMAFNNELQKLLNKDYITACTRCTGTNDATLSPGIQI